MTESLIRAAPIPPPPSQTQGFFPEPFNIPEIATLLLEERFYQAAYVAINRPEKWYACANQLPPLFMAFMAAQQPDDKLYDLVTLMWRWAGRFGEPERSKAREHLPNILDFIDSHRVARMVQRQKNRDNEWREPPWKVWPL